MYWFEPDASIVESATCGCSRSKEISKIRKEGCCTRLEGGKEGPKNGPGRDDAAISGRQEGMYSSEMNLMSRVLLQPQLVS